MKDLGEHKMNLQLKTLNPNNPSIAGEILRARVFTQKKGRGCYHDFSTFSDFVKIDITKNTFVYMDFLKIIFGHLEGDVSKEEIEETQAYENSELFCMWHWDGDGDLLIYVKDEDVCFYNDDCKKDYVWNMIDFNK
jgi:hypothetical protein